jgi:hypothetical protein
MIDRLLIDHQTSRYLLARNDSNADWKPNLRGISMINYPSEKKNSQQQQQRNTNEKNVNTYNNNCSSFKLVRAADAAERKKIPTLTTLLLYVGKPR